MYVYKGSVIAFSNAKTLIKAECMFDGFSPLNSEVIARDSLTDVWIGGGFQC